MRQFHSIYAGTQLEESPCMWNAWWPHFRATFSSLTGLGKAQAFRARVCLQLHGPPHLIRSPSSDRCPPHWAVTLGAWETQQVPSEPERDPAACMLFLKTVPWDSWGESGGRERRKAAMEKFHASDWKQGSSGAFWQAQQHGCSCSPLAAALQSCTATSLGGGRLPVHMRAPCSTPPLHPHSTASTAQHIPLLIACPHWRSGRETAKGDRTLVKQRSSHSKLSQQEFRIITCSVSVHSSGFPRQAGRQNCRNKEGVRCAAVLVPDTAQRSADTQKGLILLKGSTAQHKCCFCKCFTPLIWGSEEVVSTEKGTQPQLLYERAPIPGFQTTPKFTKDDENSHRRSRREYRNCHHVRKALIQLLGSPPPQPQSRSWNLPGMWRSKASCSARAPELTAGELVTASLLHNNLNQILIRSKQKLI